MITLERPPQTAPPLAPAPPRRPAPPRASVRQLVVGLLALPLTVLPFVAYANLTPEGRLVRDRAIVALSPPKLPRLTPQQRAAALAAAPRYEGAVMAVAYHGIGSATDGEGGFVVSAKRFGEHLATLRAAGMNAVTAAQVADAFTGGAPLPPNAVMLSFDDGRADAMMWADPLLRQAGMSATMFLISGAASEPGIYYASWDRIESYARSGRWDIQSHTAGSHREHEADGGESLPMLTSLAPDETPEAFRARIGDDMARASAAIEAHVGRAPVAFAYPFGAYGADRSNDPAVAQIVREEVGRRYAVAFQQDDQETVPLLTADQDLLRLRRVEVENWSGVDLLHRIERARRSLGGQGAAPADPPAEPGPPVVAEGEPAAPASSPTPTTSTSVARSAGQPVQAATVSPTTVPGPTAPPAAVQPVTPATVPPTTRPSVPVTTAPPPTTAPPTTRPPSPTTTSPPTTAACKPAGKSGKCLGGR
ncbi:MAG TPA: polysaccharide deacetylase family protein [Acidimicrobiales bacterium]|nr:polysaccharide deacetylase family protein [Acidimicrobiales bacterium]